MTRAAGLRPWLAIALAVASGASCYRGTARSVTLDQVAAEPGWTLVSGVRLIRQEAEHECGIAALAMVLDHWGVPYAEREIRQNLGPTPHQGVPAGQLRDLARGRGLRAYLVVGLEGDLRHEVRANRPVLVGLVQRYGTGQVLTHYEVVVGFHESTRRVLLFDPARGPREDDFASFEREWTDAGRPTLVVAPART
jgi:uncharacterized protein